MVTSNVLERRFNPTQPDQALVTDIAYIKTVLGTVMDLFFRRIIGWSMTKRIIKELVWDALLMAV